MSFFNEARCTIVINNNFEITLESGRGFESSYEDVIIKKFAIKESGVPYEFIASY